MAPQPEQPELSSAQDRAVRDLLAGARHTGPVPADVASRLDDTLAELVAERASAGEAPSTALPTEPAAATSLDAGPDTGAGATVVPLARRRRRLVGLGLVAAAAAVVGGVAVTEVLPRMAGQGGDASEVAGGGSSLDAGAEQEERAAVPQEDRIAAARLGGPQLSPDTFRRDVLRARSLLVQGRDDRADAASEPQSGTADGENRDQALPGGRDARLSPKESARAFVTGCGVDPGPGRSMVVQYADAPALLVLRPAAGGRQRADLYPCGATEPLRSVVLRAR